VFLAVWNGKKIALKHFDVGKDENEAFDNEIEAYTKLKDASLLYGFLSRKYSHISWPWRVGATDA
jgi:hypothetical protein